MSIYINSGDVTPLSIWEEYEDRLVTGQSGEIEITPLSGSTVIYSDVIQADKPSLDYKKKLDYLLQQFISEHLQQEDVSELMRVFLKYLDEKIYQKIRLLENLNYEEDWFVETLFKQFTANLVNEKFVQLGIEDKRKFYKLGKYLSNLKGTKLSLETMLGFLNQTTLLNKNSRYVFENVLDFVNENENNLNIDEEPNPKLFIAPFTYGYESKERFDDVDEVIAPFHPIGFRYSVTLKELLDRTEIIPQPVAEHILRKVYPYKYNGFYQKSGANFIQNGIYLSELRHKPFLDEYVDNRIELSSYSETIPFTYNELAPVSNKLYPVIHNGFFDKLGVNIKNDDFYLSKVQYKPFLDEYVDNRIELSSHSETIPFTYVEQEPFTRQTDPVLHNGFFNKSGIVYDENDDYHLSLIKYKPYLDKYIENKIELSSHSETIPFTYSFSGVIVNSFTTIIKNGFFNKLGVNLNEDLGEVQSVKNLPILI